MAKKRNKRKTIITSSRQTKFIREYNESRTTLQSFKRHALEISLVVFGISLIWAVLYVYNIKMKPFSPDKYFIKDLIEQKQIWWEGKYPEGFKLIYAVQDKIVYQSLIPRRTESPVFEDFNKKKSEEQQTPRVEIPVYRVVETSVDTLAKDLNIAWNKINVRVRNADKNKQTEPLIEIEIPNVYAKNNNDLPMPATLVFNRRIGERHEFFLLSGKKMYVEFIEDQSDKLYLLFGLPE